MTEPLKNYRVLQSALGRGMPPALETVLALLDSLKVELRDYGAGIAAARNDLVSWSPDPSEVDDDAGAWKYPPSHPINAPGDSYSDEDEERWDSSAEGKRWNAALRAEAKKLESAEALLDAVPDTDDAIRALTELRASLTAFASWWRKAGSKLPDITQEYKP